MAIAVLAVLLVLNLALSVLTLAAVGRETLRRQGFESVAVQAHNIVADRLSEVAEHQQNLSYIVPARLAELEDLGPEPIETVDYEAAFLSRVNEW